MSKRVINNLLKKNITIGRGISITQKKVTKGRYGSKQATKRVSRKSGGARLAKTPLSKYTKELDAAFKKRYKGRNKTIPITTVRKIARFEMKRGVTPYEASRRAHHFTATGRIALGTIKQAKQKDVPMYCGVSSVPKGKQRGTPEYCLRSKQVRYYGRKVIDKKLLKPKVAMPTIQDEKIKFKLLELRAKRLIRDVKHIKIIIEHAKSTDKQVKAAKKKLDALIVRRNNLVKSMKLQQNIINNMELMAKK